MTDKRPSFESLPTRELADRAAGRLYDINGVFACAVRAHSVAPPSPEDAQVLAEARADAEGLSGPTRREAIQKSLDAAEKEMRAILAAAPPPFPHLLRGTTEEIGAYLCALTDLLALGHDERIDAKVGQVRLVSEAWDRLVIGVAIPIHDAGVKSLARTLRRTRKDLGGG